MKTIQLTIILTLLSCGTFAQRGHGNGGHGNGGHGNRGHGNGHVRIGGGHGRKHGGNVVIVNRSNYRPKNVVVFHPNWYPNHSYNRRWVYFPKHNFYWDNWRNHYVFYDGNTWISQPTAPPVIINLNLEKEKHYELKEKEDDDDDVYKGNDNHKSEFKPE
ncbi:MAG: hypothetical protein HYX39_08995 [Bacteroidetes bacterium]|nr:hypothetical protein [Bacteroidota bacterium]